MQIALCNKHLFLIATDFSAVKIYDRPKYSNNKPQTVIRTQSLISLYCSFALPIVLIQPVSVPAPLPGSVILAFLYGAMQIYDTVQKHFID